MAFESINIFFCVHVVCPPALATTIPDEETTNYKTELGSNFKLTVSIFSYFKSFVEYISIYNEAAEWISFLVLILLCFGKCVWMQ